MKPFFDGRKSKFVLFYGLYEPYFFKEMKNG